MLVLDFLYYRAAILANIDNALSVGLGFSLDSTAIRGYYTVLVQENDFLAKASMFGGA